MLVSFSYVITSLEMRISYIQRVPRVQGPYLSRFPGFLCVMLNLLVGTGKK